MIKDTSWELLEGVNDKRYIMGAFGISFTAIFFPFKLCLENYSEFTTFSVSLKENFTLIIFSLFRLNWPRTGFCNPIL